MALRKLVVGNWKMHGTSADLGEIEDIAAAARSVPSVDVALCVPATLIERAARAVPGFAIGSQDVHHADKGAHTGCVCAGMLIDAGATLTIVGHSERRDAQRETDEEAKAKAEAASAAGLRVIFCVGENQIDREVGKAVEVVELQVDHGLPDVSSGKVAEKLAVAYEPIWAIGTGKVASVDDIAEMHAAIRGRLVAIYGLAGEKVRILYGGSVKASNAPDIFAVANVDGALVGGASLKAADFIPIVEAAAAVEAPVGIA